MTNCQSPSLRAWQALMDKLVGMKVEAVPGQKDIFRFSSTERMPVTMHIKKEWSRHEDGVLIKTVELMDESGKVVASETWYRSDSLFAKNEAHPLDAFFELIEVQESSGLYGLQGIRAVQEASAN